MASVAATSTMSGYVVDKTKHAQRRHDRHQRTVMQNGDLIKQMREQCVLAVPPPNAWALGYDEACSI